MDTQTIITGSVAMMGLLVIPGYSLTMGLFSRKELNLSWKIGLSVLLGLVPPLILYALNKNAGIPINTNTSTLSLVFVTCVGVVLWWSNRGKLH